MLSRLLPLAALAPLVFATHYHEVEVGGVNHDGTPDLSFDPPYVHAAVGDKVRFKFNVKNHTVTQSSFDEPCAKLTNAWGHYIGFDSGFKFVQPTDEHKPEFTVDVHDMNPIWGYCQQVSPAPNPTHCQSGMVFAINPPKDGDKTFEHYLARAKASTVQSSWDHPKPSYDHPQPAGYAHEPTPTEGHDWPDKPAEHWPEKPAENWPEEPSHDWPDKPAEHWPEKPAEHWPEKPAENWPEEPAHDKPAEHWPDKPAGHPQNHEIVVGGDAKTVGFVFTPSNIVANVGDTVTFKFMVKNHTVTQSSFEDPCKKLDHGFDSGFKPVAAGDYNFPTYSITVHDKNPIWGYCQQNGPTFSHCGVGMVFSINADPHGKSFDAFQQNAVKKYGKGFVDPFATGQAPAQPSHVVADPQGLNALGSDGSDADSGLLNKLANTYVPAALGLLAVTIVMLAAVLAISVMLLRRSGKNTGVSRSVTPNYAAVPLTMPTSKMTDEGAHDYETPRYSDH